MVAVGHLGIQPSEFYAMRPQEFYLLWETRRPKLSTDYQGTLNERQLAELYELLPERKK